MPLGGKLVVCTSLARLKPLPRQASPELRALISCCTRLTPKAGAYNGGVGNRGLVGFCVVHWRSAALVVDTGAASGVWISVLDAQVWVGSW